MKTGIWPRIRNQFHYALYSAIIVVTLMIHGNEPIDSAAGKLTIMLMALLMLAESAARILAALRANRVAGAQEES